MRKIQAPLKNDSHDNSYWVFGYDTCYPSGGIRDLRGRFATQREAVEFAKKEVLRNDYVEILDVRNYKVIHFGGGQGNDDDARAKNNDYVQNEGICLNKDILIGPYHMLGVEEVAARIAVVLKSLKWD